MHRIGATILGVAAATTLAFAAGKPGYPDKVVWNGVIWAVKTSRSAVGPGPNLFEKTNVSVDGQGRLHLRTANNAGGAWSCAEIIGPTSYGYGTYTFRVDSPVNAFNQNVVLGSFTWRDKAPYAHREIDIEFAKWGNAADPTNGRATWESYDVNGGPIEAYTYTGSDVPRPGDERVHVNLWLFGGAAPTDGQPVDVVLSSFTFAP